MKSFYQKLLLIVAVVAVGVLSVPGLELVVNAANKVTVEVAGEEVTQSNATYTADNNYQIVVYSWNAEVGDRVKYFIEQYPQYKFRVKCVEFNVSGVAPEYWNNVKKYAFNKSNNTSIVAFDSWVTEDYISYFDSVSKVGITSKDYAYAYDYTKKKGTSNGQLKGLAWQAMPGGFIYNASIAQKVLGTSDPAKVQAYISTPEKFLETAEKMKNAGYYMVSGLDRFMYDGGDKDISASELQEAKFLYNQSKAKGYMPSYLTWTNEWYDDGNNGKVFGYVSAPWFANFSVPGDKISYRTCEGPISYVWGRYLFNSYQYRKE